MRRIDADAFCGSPQGYVAQIDIDTERAELLWGAGETSWDDLGPWFTFAFVLESGTLVALVREIENAPCPGYILTAIGDKGKRDVLVEFLGEADLTMSQVLHQGFE
ncbi:hypothetical protein ACX9I7_19785 [Streptomyces sp. L500]